MRQWPRLISQFMQAAGDVRSARVTRYPDGRSKGWGLVDFVDASSAADVIANYNDVELMGRKIFIREDRDTGAGGEGGGGGGGGGGGKGGGRGKGKGGDGAARGGRGRGRARPPLEVPEVEATSGTSLYVGNLTWATTSVQLREVFSEYSVKSAEVKAGYDGRSRGYGIVTFESEEVIECLRLPWLAFDCY
jgi:RNA recognition motif-containing protein